VRAATSDYPLPPMPTVIPGTELSSSSSRRRGEPVVLLAHGPDGEPERACAIFAPFLPGTKVLMDFRGTATAGRPAAGSYTSTLWPRTSEAVADEFGVLGGGRGFDGRPRCSACLEGTRAVRQDDHPAAGPARGMDETYSASRAWPTPRGATARADGRDRPSGGGAGGAFEQFPRRRTTAGGDPRDELEAGPERDSAGSSTTSRSADPERIARCRPRRDHRQRGRVHSTRSPRSSPILPNSDLVISRTSTRCVREIPC
jgi:hypothetical protein